MPEPAGPAIFNTGNGPRHSGPQSACPRPACLLFAVAGADAAPLKFSIGENRPPLLYSSEGCSSCPPTGKWLDELTPLQAAGGWLDRAARCGRQQEEFAAQAPSRDVNY